MNRKLKAIALLAPAALLLATSAQADVTYSGVPADTYTRFGSKAAMDVWAQDLNYYILGDNRINQVFGFNGDYARSKALQDDLETLILTGSTDQNLAVKYGLSLTETQYNAVVENAYLACEASRTRYQVCNRIVAAMAPFEHQALAR
jgi:hemoglobin